MQKELTQQKTIQKQNKQQNADVLTKTAPAMMQKKNTDAEFDKILRRPRSKKKLKLYAEVDLPSMTDEEIMERMRKEMSSGMADGSSWGGSAPEDITQENISQEDIAAYLLSRQEEFIKMVQGEIREEEERIRKEEEERMNRKLGVLSRCTIPGCVVHSIPADDNVSWEYVDHYGCGEIPGEFQQAWHLYQNCDNCICVEIYEGRLVAIAASGEVIKIKKL